MNYTILSDTPAYGIIDSRSNYLVNLQIGIWNKAILTNILVEGESPWEFELKASKRFAKNNFLSLCVRENRKLNHVHGPIVYLCGALTKGVIMRDAIRLCKKENIEFNINGKKVETLEEEILRRSYIALPLSIRKVIGYLKASVKRIISK